MKKFHSETSAKIIATIIVVMFIVGLLFVLAFTPTIRAQAGDEMAQKIFYYHVPSAWIAFLAYFLVMIAGIQYLRTRKSKWDWIGLASAEVGTFFCVLVLISGPVWAKAAWGVPWTWEPRLLTTLILFLIYVGYFMLRQFGGHYERVARNSAVLGIVAFVDVPIVYLSLKFWSEEVQVHPQAQMASQSTTILWVFFFILLSFTLLFIHMIRFRAHILSLKQRLLEQSYGI